MAKEVVTDNNHKKLSVGDAVMILGFNEWWELHAYRDWRHASIGSLGMVQTVYSNDRVEVKVRLESRPMRCLYFNTEDLERIATCKSLDKVDNVLKT